MTPVVNRLELRTAIGQTPPAVRDALMAAYTEGGYRPLTDDTWTVDELNALAAHLVAAASTVGHKLHVPLDTSGLAERIAALPDDLADLAALKARDAEGGLPNVAHANRWTLEHWFAGDDIIGHAEELAAARLRHVHAALGQAGMSTDEDRHSIVRIVTDDRTASSRKLTGPEAAHVARWAEDVAVRGIDTVGLPTAYVPDWKAEAKRVGVTQAELLKQAKEWARVHRFEAPKALADVTGHRAIAALLTTALDGRTAITDIADGLPELANDTPVPAEPAPTATPAAAELTEAQTEALFAEARGEAVAEPAPTVAELEQTEPAVEPAEPTLTTLLARLGPSIARHAAARGDYLDAYNDLLALFNDLGVVGVTPTAPAPVAEVRTS